LLEVAVGILVIPLGDGPSAQLDYLDDLAVGGQDSVFTVGDMAAEV